MKWYKIYKGVVISIESINVVRETEKCVFIGNNRGMTRCSKESEYEAFFKNLEDAKKYAERYLDRNENGIRDKLANVETGRRLIRDFKG